MTDDETPLVVGFSVALGEFHRDGTMTVDHWCGVRPERAETIRRIMGTPHLSSLGEQARVASSMETAGLMAVEHAAEESEPAPPRLPRYDEDRVPPYDPQVRSHFWTLAIMAAVSADEIRACRAGEPVGGGEVLRVSPIHCAYCGWGPDEAEALPCEGRRP